MLRGAIRFPLIVAFVSVACSQSPVKPTAASSTPTASTPTASTPTAPAVVLTGDYTLTLMASPSCVTVADYFTGRLVAFPDSARIRSYEAKVTQDSSGNVTTDLTGVGDARQYPIRLKGGLVGSRFSLHNDPWGPFSCSDWWWEEFAPTEYFEACGSFSATVDDSQNISGTLNGMIGYGIQTLIDPTHVRTDLLLECPAADHAFALIKRSH